MARGNGKDIILQAFHWNLVKTKGTGTMDWKHESWYKVLTNMADEIADIGFTIVYLPPPWIDDSHWENEGKHGGGEGYFWRDFDLNSRYGSKQELTALIAKLHSLGIKVIVDLVTNHRDGSRMQQDIWEHPGEHWSIGRRDTGGTFMDGKYDLALDNPKVNSRFVAAMDELMLECGVDGWRWDYVWGYAVEDVVEWIKRTKGEEYFSVGEYWQSSPYLTNDPMVKKYGQFESDRIIGWARDSKGCAFDICLKREIQTADPSNLKYGLNLRKNPDERASIVTFVDNHDMGASPYSHANGWGQECWSCPPQFKSSAYAFILTAPGTPCVYWPDCFDWGHKEEIKQLIALRKKAGIVSNSDWIDLTKHHSGFAGIILNELGKEALAISIGSNFHDPGSGWTRGYEKPSEWTVWIRET